LEFFDGLREGGRLGQEADFKGLEDVAEAGVEGALVGEEEEVRDRDGTWEGGREGGREGEKTKT
jgi:hypothetical protein